MDLRPSLGRLVRQLASQLSIGIEKRLNHFDVTMAEWSVIHILYRNHIVRPTDLARHVRFDKSVLTRIVRKLEDKRFVRTNVCEGYSRSKCLTLTESGRVLASQLITLINLSGEDVLFRLSDEEMLQFEALLERAMGAETAAESRQLYSDP